MFFFVLLLALVLYISKFQIPGYTKILIMYLITVFLICSYGGLVFYFSFKADKERSVFLDLPLVNGFAISGWSISHYILYFVLGFYFPEYIYLILISSSIWELIEEGIAYIVRNYFAGDKLAYMRDSWKMQGNTWDVIWNNVGMVCGYGAAALVCGSSVPSLTVFT